MTAADYFEIGMILAFGISWPINLLKALRAKTTKGTSLLFLLLIFFGYISGIIAKFINPSYMANFASKWYVLIVYFFNLIVVSLNIVVYFRNRKLDQANEARR